MSRGVQPIWWGGWPWKWRVYYVRRSQWGAFGELLIGPIGFTWSTDEPDDGHGQSDPRPDPRTHPEYWTE